MKKLVILFACLFLLGTSAVSGADISKVGTSGAQFLKIGVGAQNIGKGNAVTACIGDITSVFWNPAGLANLNGSEVSFTHTEWIAEINYDNIAYGFPMGQGVAGVFFGILSMPEFEETTVEQPEGTGVNFSCYDLVVGASYARKLSDRFSFGLNAKFIRQAIWELSANGLAFDMGFQYATGFRSLKLGMSMSNFGTNMRYSGQQLRHETQIYPGSPPTYQDIPVNVESKSYPLPLLFRIGLSYNFIEDEDNLLMASMDGIQPNDGREMGAFGMEYSYRNNFFVRAGYELCKETGYEGGFTAGAGFAYKLTSRMSAKIDYAYADFGLLDQVHRFTLGLGF
ncbi:MAG: PorV/PorQ family protein [candidate division Zixibacteria bacterium]|nr:PorV/PorQ family protein [candidate division Zixibacteria bacterium]